jgi:hypothetical protein
MAKSICQYQFVPEEICGISFSPLENGRPRDKATHSEMVEYTTIRGEQLILDFKDGKLISIELLGDKKPCQRFDKEE